MTTITILAVVGIATDTLMFGVSIRLRVPVAIETTEISVIVRIGVASRAFVPLPAMRSGINREKWIMVRQFRRAPGVHLMAILTFS